MRIITRQGVWRVLAIHICFKVFAEVELFAELTGSNTMLAIKRCKPEK
jgi:hypothetical protein